MLDSVKIQRRQSEIRQELSALVGKTDPSEDETRSMESLDHEYRANEIRYRAALVAEDDERRAARDALESRGADEWGELVGRFELRQAALALDEGRPLDGATKEIVDELRAKGGYRGIPIPLEALEQRADTVSSGTFNPSKTAPVIDRIFAGSVSERMGARFINVGVGDQDTPVTTSQVAASWAATEGGDLGAPVAFTTVDRPLKPDHTLGIRMSVTRKALKQSGAALEQAVRRDMSEAIRVAMDAAVIRGSGSSGEPTGVLNLTVSPAIASTAVNAKASYGVFREAARRLMDVNAAAGPSEVRALVRPLTWSILDGDLLSGTAETEWDRLLRRFGERNVIVSDNALPAADPEDATDKGAHTVLLSCVTGGVPPIFAGLWGAVDMIRDPYTDAASGGLRLTGLLTMDVTVSRSQQLQILTGIQDRA